MYIGTCGPGMLVTTMLNGSSRVRFRAEGEQHGWSPLGGLRQHLGTEAETSLIADLHASGSSNPTNFRGFDGRLYFTATGSANGAEVFVIGVPKVPLLGPLATLLLLVSICVLGSASGRLRT